MSMQDKEEQEMEKTHRDGSKTILRGTVPGGRLARFVSEDTSFRVRKTSFTNARSILS